MKRCSFLVTKHCGLCCASGLAQHTQFHAACQFRFLERFTLTLARGHRYGVPEPRVVLYSWFQSDRHSLGLSVYKPPAVSSWSWTVSPQAVCNSRQYDQPSNAWLLGVHQVIQEAATTARACQIPSGSSRHAKHAGPGGQVLCRDILSGICHRQLASSKRITGVRAAHRIQGT